MKDEHSTTDLKSNDVDEAACCDETMDTQELKDKKTTTSLSFEYVWLGISFILLVSGLTLKHLIQWPAFNGWLELAWYVSAYLPVAYPILIRAFQTIKHGAIFTEYSLMSLATICAFFIREYPEGVAVMLFYTVGELLQERAVRRARLNIETLLDVRPKLALVSRDGRTEQVNPETIAIGETLLVRAGEKVPLDGELLSEDASLNTAALTGESMPLSIVKGDSLLAGSVNLSNVIQMKATKAYRDSSIAKMIELVQNASSRKAKTELLIRRLAKIYTPIVVYLAIGICFIPYFIFSDYDFTSWLYRALIFLVISCPCALVISIPLSYFGGLGAASKQGLLFKGAVYMDRLVDLSILAFDKTGTVTKGELKVVDVYTHPPFEEGELMDVLKAVEQQSNHPMALAVRRYGDSSVSSIASDVHEVAGKGIIGTINGQVVVAGNTAMMAMHGIETQQRVSTSDTTALHVGINNRYAGTVSIEDELKEDAVDMMRQLRSAGVKQFIMLSGDAEAVTQKVGNILGVERVKGGLLPHEKLEIVEDLKRQGKGTVGFMGDGINDAAVLAASDVGIAMGALGSDLAIETADVIIQSDKPSKLATGIRIARATKSIIWQNIALAMGVKVIVLVLGAIGMATMWAAVFADVGVALLAILNAVRLQWKSWD